jgi:nitrite reductase/ring-hydroxylating ferredoxin subunit/uncharacterized membrane protein
MDETVRKVRALIEQIGADRRLDAIAQPLDRAAATLTRRDNTKRLLSGSWLGHRLHPLLTDIPLGTWMSASILDLVGGRARRTSAQRLVGIGILASIPTAAAGLSDWHDTHGAEKRVGVTHALANATGLTFQLASWRERRRGHWFRGATLSAVGGACAIVGGYLGGHLVFTQGVGVDHEVPAPDVPEWRRVCAVDELAERQPHGVTVNGACIALVKRGTVVNAMAAVCPHAGGPLDEGTVTEAGLRCPWHGSEFALHDGGVMRGPATSPQPVYDARLRDGYVEIRGPITDQSLAIGEVVITLDEAPVESSN